MAAEAAPRWLLCQRLQVRSPALIWQLTAVCNSSSRGPDAFFWSLLALHTCSAETYKQAKHPHPQNKTVLIFFFKKKGVQENRD